MPKMYGSMLCPDCVEAKEYFEKINYKYDFVNITESMANLKEFLHLRDTRKEFEEVKSLKYVTVTATGCTAAVVAGRHFSVRRIVRTDALIIHSTFFHICLSF